MNVNVLSETKQEYDGVVYYKCGPYFQHKGKRLHRKVWETEMGAIPKGMHVHHIDGNKANNAIENLRLLPKGEHAVHHVEKRIRAHTMPTISRAALDAASAWHGSTDGISWHSQQGRENWRKRCVNTYTCNYCGKEYQTKYIYPQGMNHFCGNNCKAAYRRRRLREGIES